MTNSMTPLPASGLNQSQPVLLRPFKPEDQVAVKNLVLSGLVEHWGVLDPTRNPDLDDIADSYANAVFLVAWLEDRIIGTGALLPREGGVAEIVRMSVARDFRRLGVGRRILNALCTHARRLGCKQVVLETTATWTEVIEFYLRYGFRITHTRDGDVYFSLDL